MISSEPYIFHTFSKVLVLTDAIVCPVLRVLWDRDCIGTEKT